MGWKIAICDDDAGQAARLQSDVTDWAHGACAVTCFPSAEAFRFAGDTDWDILLLDVEMPGMSGIDLAKRLRGAGCRAEIIFITSHFECMAEGYEVDALHYLVKPVPAEKLRAVLDRAAARLAVEPPSVVIACEEGNVKLYESKLPKNAPVRDQSADLTALAGSLQGISFLDVSAALSAHTDEQLYYRTDHHWTSLGARYAFEAMAAQLGISQPIQNYDTYTVSTTFEGTLASRSGSHAAYDTVELYVPQTDVEYYVSYGDAAETSATIYDRSALDQKDKYTVFFGGNYPRVDVYTTAETGKTLLLFKDSYANCLMQFLYPYYDHIILIDPRYYYDNVESVISREQVTDVLFLYNANTYFEDTSLADVLNVSEN